MNLEFLFFFDSMHRDLLIQAIESIMYLISTHIYIHNILWNLRVRNKALSRDDQPR